MTDYGITQESQILVLLNINLKQALVTEIYLTHKKNKYWQIQILISLLTDCEQVTENL